MPLNRDFYYYNCMLRLPFVTKNDKIPQNVLATSTSQTDATDPSTTVATITAATLMLQLYYLHDLY